MEQETLANNRSFHCYELSKPVVTLAFTVGISAHYFTMSRTIPFQHADATINYTFIAFFLNTTLEVLYLGRCKKQLMRRLCLSLCLRTVLFAILWIWLLVEIDQLVEDDNAYWPLIIEGISMFMANVIMIICIVRKAPLESQVDRFILMDKLECRLQDLSHKEKESVCVICLEELGKHKLIALPCSLPSRHCFHLQCFEIWFRKSRNCPLCQTDRYITNAKKMPRIKRLKFTRRVVVDLSTQNVESEEALASDRIMSVRRHR